MRHSWRHHKILIALFANALLLALILLSLVSREGRWGNASSAFGQALSQPPIAGGNGQYVMPAQLSPNTWGCYLLDSENHTLCVYQYSPGERMLRFAAARNIANDRQLSNFNTMPPPSEVKDLVDREHQGPQSLQPATKPMTE